jgi:hypothetical protein
MRKFGVVKCRTHTQVLDEPVSTTRAKVCEQKEIIATYAMSLLMAITPDARTEIDSDLLLYAAMRARSRPEMSLAVIDLPEVFLRTGITTRFSF